MLELVVIKQDTKQGRFERGFKSLPTLIIGLIKFRLTAGDSDWFMVKMVKAA